MLAVNTQEIELKLINALNPTTQQITQNAGKNQKTLDTNDTGSLGGDDDHVNRPSIRGAYRPIRNGTIRGSIFAMLASALGTGNLNLSFRVFQLGIVPFIFILLLTAFLSYLGMYLMSRVICRYKIASYSKMVERAYGRTTMRMAEIILILYPLVAVTCMQVIVSKFVMQILHDVVGLDVYESREYEIYNWKGNVMRVLVAFLIIVLNYYNFLKEDLRELLHSLGKFSVTGCVFNMVVIAITAFIGFQKEYQGQTIEYNNIFTMSYEHVEMFKPFTGSNMFVFMQCFAGIFFTFLNHQFIFPLISHLKRPTKKRVNYIFEMAHLEEIIIYSTVGLLGYILLSQHLDIIPIGTLVIASIKSLPLTFGKIALIVAIFLGVPLQIFNAREYTYEALDIDRNQKNKHMISYVLIGSTLLVSIIFQEINAYFGLIGGTVGILMACGIPGFCMYKLVPLSVMDKIILGFVGVMSVFCMVGGIFSVMH